MSRTNLLCFFLTVCKSTRITSRNHSQLEMELRTEDIVNLKCRRTDNRRDGSRNEQFCTDCTALSLDELDAGSMKQQFEKINSDIAIAEVQQNAILGHLKRGDEEKEENEHHSYQLNCFSNIDYVCRAEQSILHQFRNTLQHL